VQRGGDIAYTASPPVTGRAMGNAVGRRATRDPRLQTRTPAVRQARPASLQEAVSAYTAGGRRARIRDAVTGGV